MFFEEGRRKEGEREGCRSVPATYQNDRYTQKTQTSQHLCPNACRKAPNLEGNQVIAAGVRPLLVTILTADLAQPHQQ
jgi:hypothetical protein